MMIRVIKTTPTGRKIIDIQKNVWQQIMNGLPLPIGVTYELAPESKPKVIEIINDKETPKSKKDRLEREAFEKQESIDNAKAISDDDKLEAAELAAAQDKDQADEKVAKAKKSAAKKKAPKKKAAKKKVSKKKSKTKK